MKYFKIRIDEQVYLELQNRATPFVDKTPNDVLRRKLLLGKSNERDNNTEASIIPNIRSNALTQILEVYFLTVKGFTRNEATHNVADSLNISYQSIFDKYTRQLDLSSDEIDELLRDANRKKFALLLKAKFRQYNKEIELFFSNIERHLNRKTEKSYYDTQENQSILNNKIIPKNKQGNITQDELIPHIVRVLQNSGGSAAKIDVENEIFQKFQSLFEQSWYQGKVSHGVFRWKHFIAWAKERAVKKGLIKSGKESVRGIWVLTDKGKQL